MLEPLINEIDNNPRRQLQVVGHTMSLVDVGEGPPLFFLHGNATYSYVWRNLLPYLSLRNRCIAPDRIGMGESELAFPSGPASYAFEDHLENLESLIELTEPDRRIVLVTHELGSALAVQIARRHPDTVAGIVMIEGVLRVTNDATFDAELREFLLRARGEEGEQMVLRENRLIEEYLPRLIARQLTWREMEAYRRPYVQPGESRRAMLSMIRQLPLQSSPGPIDELVEENRLWCAQESVPKLVIGGRPGFLVSQPILASTAKWSATSVATVPGLHFLMEDSPARLTSLILDWLEELGHV